jgi:subtilase family serine protease
MRRTGKSTRKKSPKPKESKSVGEKLVKAKAARPQTRARSEAKRPEAAKSSRTSRRLPRFRSYVTGLEQPRGAVGLAATGWKVTDLLAAYSWPTQQRGGGVIAILAGSGGWRPQDVQAFAESIGQPMPNIVDVPIDLANNPGVDSEGDIELAMDTQLAAASYCFATGQPATIRVYWTPVFVRGIQAALRDGCDVCSISWGASEDQWTQSAAQAVEAIASTATGAGMTIFAASGDNDSSDGSPSGPNVDLPASCPHIIGCGGTTKTASDETVWNNSPGLSTGTGTGGGFSAIFKPIPDWQIGAPNGPGRMVPDVAANADILTGYNLILNGNPATLGGTSAVSPLFAGLFAAFGRKLGFVTPKLWNNPLCFNDIAVGDNGLFRADRGPDPCTGLGSPIGTKIANLFSP